MGAVCLQEVSKGGSLTVLINMPVCQEHESTLNKETKSESPTVTMKLYTCIAVLTGIQQIYHLHFTLR